MPIKPTYPIDISHNARIAIVGEAPGETEAKLGQPFVGASGIELTSMLGEAGIVREQCLLTNVFLDRPPSNNIYSWCLKKKEADAAWIELGNSGKYPFAPLKAGAYIDPKRLGEVRRLHRELVLFDPTIIIVLGNTPLWALTGESGISKSRGTLTMVDLGGTREYKVLPTYHPAYILRNWEERAIVVADLTKANREKETIGYTRPKRELWLEPDHQDIIDFTNQHLLFADEFSLDIETAMGQITCIGFGTETHAICIPFTDSRKKGLNYWATPEEEISAWKLVKEIAAMPNAKLGQNLMYDMQWLWAKMGITLGGEIQDTMLMHHSMFPEMQKSLGFLGSIYTNEASWKKLRPKKTTTDKKGDTDE